jgi:hypothetical protein
MGYDRRSITAICERFVSMGLSLELWNLCNEIAWAGCLRWPIYPCRHIFEIGGWSNWPFECAFFTISGSNFILQFFLIFDQVLDALFRWHFKNAFSCIQCVVYINSFQFHMICWISFSLIKYQLRKVVILVIGWMVNNLIVMCLRYNTLAWLKSIFIYLKEAYWIYAHNIC